MIIPLLNKKIFFIKGGSKMNQNELKCIFQNRKHFKKSTHKKQYAEKFQGVYILIIRTTNRNYFQQLIRNTFITNNFETYLFWLGYSIVKKNMLFYSVTMKNNTLANELYSASINPKTNDFDIRVLRNEANNGVWFAFATNNHIVDTNKMLKSAYSLVNTSLYGMQGLKIQNKPFEYVLISELIEKGIDVVTISKGINQLVNSDTLINYDNYSDDEISEIRELLIKTLSSIRPSARKVLKYISKNYSYRQISEKLKISIGCITKYKNQAKEIATKILKNEYPNFKYVRI